MEDNPYSAPLASAEARTAKPAPDDARYGDALRLAQEAASCEAGIPVYILLAANLALAPVAACWYEFGVEWEPETGSYAVMGILVGFVSLCVTLCAALVTMYRFRKLTKTARCCGLATIAVFAAGMAFTLLSR